jgi:hypothetical protein
MNKLKITLYYSVPIVIALCLIVFVYRQKKDAKMFLCQHPYALCTSARCVPQPGNPSQAICFCDVEEGKSMATTPCNKLEPRTDAHGINTIYSTFSYKQYAEGKQVMQCPGNTPWTWCLNKQCTVDPSNPKRALCLCNVMRTEEPWITFGGECDPSTCNTAYWSGAGLKDFHEGNVFMTQQMNLEQSPVKWCQGECQ